MTKKIRKNIIAVTFLAILITFVAIFGFTSKAQNVERNNVIDFNLVSEEGEKIEIVKNGTTEYSIVFSTDTISGDATMAASISSLLSINYGVSISLAPDSVTSTSNFEILLGQTNRPESAELLTKVQAACKSSDDLAWGYAVINGKLLYLANSDKAYSFGSEEFITYLVNNNFAPDGNLNVVKSIPQEEYEEVLRQERLDTLLEMNGAFTDSQFNTDKYTPGEFYKPMVGNGGYFAESLYGEPWVYPSNDSHPNFLITEDSLDRVKEILVEGENPASLYYTLASEFWKRANTNIADIHYGEFQDQYKASSGASWIPPTGESYRYDATYIAVIEAKALAYLITGDELYAYEAIVAVKNAMLTLKFTTDLHQDAYHGASHVMLTVATVYDWCYDMLSETDKWQLIWGTAKILGGQLEEGLQYPPISVGGVNGHPTGAQFLRNWISVSIVFYDEVPDWWDYCGSIYFDVYLPVANEHFKNGWISQGTANYAPHKIFHHMWAALLIKNATGEVFLTEDANKTAYYLMSHITPRQTEKSYQQYYFTTGDGTRSQIGRKAEYFEYFLIAAMYNDPVIYAHALELSNYHKFSSETHNERYVMTMTHAYQLCCAAMVDYNGEGSRDGVETIQYFADPAGQITIREAWNDPDSVAIMMRLLNKTMGSHENYAHGTFQIYYKGLLALNSGAYRRYGSPSHYYYHQATLADNGLLVFNPANASDDSSNTASYFYSGSQLRTAIANNFDAWMSTGHVVDTLGADYGYNTDGTPKYAYISGDLTGTYDSFTVDYVGRKMFTLFTGDEDIPALFFTFDQIESDNADFTKHWLLHIVNEPEIDQDNLTATVINGDGKMYVESLFGADAIIKVGGTGKAFWINGYFKDYSNRGSWDEKLQDFTDPSDKGSWVEGKNATDESTTDDKADDIWGRIELRTSGEKYSKLFTVMAITDTVNEIPFEIKKFKTDDELVFGAQFKNDIVVFLNNETNHDEKQYKEATFSTEGKGLYNYYVDGLASGTWQILTDGVSVGYAFSTEESGLINFIAPAGEVTLKPGGDVIGANGGKIKYVTGGAMLPENTPYTYKNENDTPLPETATRGEDVFMGWYTSPTYEPESKTTVVPSGTTGTFTVYAKWFCTYLNEEYDTTSFYKQTSSFTANGVTHNGGGKTGCSFITKYDEERNDYYFEWIKGDLDPIISQQSESKNISDMVNEELCVSYTLRLMREPGKESIATKFDLQASKNVDGGSISGNSSRTRIFNIDKNGRVTSPSGSEVLVLSDDRITNLRVVVDFKNGEVRFYGEDFRLLLADDWNIPSGVGTTNHEEMIRCMSSYIWRMQANTAGSASDSTLRVYGIKVQEGDEFADKAPVQISGIKYNTNGALLPNDAPVNFNTDGTDTILPIITKNNAAFAGWYTTPTFDEGTKTDKVPAGSVGIYEVYAKWVAIFIDEDYSETVLDISKSAKTANGITYNGASKNGSSYKTVDENGKKYLVWTPGEKDSSIVVQNETSNIYTMTESAISYTFKISKNGEAELPDFKFRITGKHTVSGAPVSSNSQIEFARIVDGVFYLGNTTDYPVAEIGNDITTVRLVLDFATGMMEAYDENGEIITSRAFPAINSASGATTYLEYKNCFRTYLLNTSQINCSADTADHSIRYYGIRIEEGNAFAVKKEVNEEEPAAKESIIYNLNGGTISGEYPTEYDSAAETLLPTNVTKDGYVFAGWYTTSSFEESSKTDRIPSGSSGEYTVYAKWVKADRELTVFVDEDYSETVLDISESSKTANGLTYNGTKKPGSSYKTVNDNGSKYLVWTPGEKDSLIAIQNETSNIYTMTESAISYTFKISKNGEAELPDFKFRLTGKHTVSGAPVSSNSQIEFAKIVDGVFYLGSDTNNPVAEIGNDITTVRLVLDFATGMMEAYDENGEIITSRAFPAINSASGATTYLEYKNCFRTYLLNTSQINCSTETANYSIRYYGIRIEEGNAFLKG